MISKQQLSGFQAIERIQPQNEIQMKNENSFPIIIRRLLYLFRLTANTATIAAIITTTTAAAMPAPIAAAVFVRVDSTDWRAGGEKKTTTRKVRNMRTWRFFFQVDQLLVDNISSSHVALFFYCFPT